MPFSNETERVNNQPAFVLHKRPYRNTSYILDLFTYDHGRINLVAKGVSTAKSRLKGILQPFQSLQISWSRKTELGTLVSAETISPPFKLSDDALYSAMYINEILLKLTTKDDPHPQLFLGYNELLKQLSLSANVAVCLRLFEKALLQDLGYELNFYEDANSHKPIDPMKNYEFIPGHGFVESELSSANQITITGADIINLSNNDLSNKSCIKTAKIVMQKSLQQLLGGSELKTRDLYRSFLATK